MVVWVEKALGEIIGLTLTKVREKPQLKEELLA